VHFVRVLYALLVLSSGALLLTFRPGPGSIAVLVAGLLVLLASFVLEVRFRRNPTAAREMLVGMTGLFLGLVVGLVALLAVEYLLLAEFVATRRLYAGSVYLLFLAMLGYAGLVAGQAVARDAGRGRRRGDLEAGSTARFLLGEKALVDGRAVRLAQSALLAGELVVPRYVVDALQTMAASKNPLEHFRGERGLENLRTLQQIPDRRVRIHEIDVVRGETEGLLDFAREHGARLITQNEQLLAEAAARGIPTIDLNQVADLLKPDVIQGDELVVKLVKPGKEREQAVGYMEDGNMVVVENARDDVGKTVRILVTGIHQTRAGTLIFASKKEGEPVAAAPPRPAPTSP
jgi:uncharacterized protein YacL